MHHSRLRNSANSSKCVVIGLERFCREEKSDLSAKKIDVFGSDVDENLSGLLVCAL